MNNLERYLDQVIEQRPVVIEKQPEVIPDAGSLKTPNIVAILYRRWYIILVTFILGCAVCLPAIWFGVKPRYVVSSAIRITPTNQNILTGEADSGGITNYINFVQTQAEYIISGMVLERVADDFVGKNLAFFRGEDMPSSVRLRYKLGVGVSPMQPVTLLKDAIYYEIITVVPPRNSELIHVIMKSKRPDEAKQIVDSLVRNYMAVEGSSSAENRDKQLRLLEDEQRIRAEKLRSQHEQTRKLAEESGNTPLAWREDVTSQRGTVLLNELMKLEFQRITFESQVQLLEKTQGQSPDPSAMSTQREAYINADPAVQETTRSILLMEQDLLVAKQRLAPSNPAIKQKEDLLESFKSHFAEKRTDLAKVFDSSIPEQAEKTRKEQLASVKAQLEQIKTYEQYLKDTIDKQELQATVLGKTQQQIGSLQFEMNLDQQFFEMASKRFQEVEMERKRPARVSIAYLAEIRNVEDKRIKFSAAAMFGILGLGAFFAFLQNKKDKTLVTPEDITTNVGVPLIGTTTSSHNVKPAQFAEQLAGDYQIIRTNLDLLSSEGMPKRLCITSPGMREGKTTFAINLATSMAKAGKKVLLIDGDLRKPDVANMLGITTNGSGGLQEVLAGADFSQFLRSVSSSGLDVLPAGPGRTVDIFELLASSTTVKQIDRISQKYDHVIIDTPPALIFPDALIWAKMVDGIILVTFAGKTTTPDLMEAKERLTKARARILGTILSNVSAENSYYRVGYAYYSHGGRAARKAGRISKKLLLPHDAQQKGKSIAET